MRMLKEKMADTLATKGSTRAAEETTDRFSFASFSCPNEA